MKEIRYVVEDLTGDAAPVAVIEPGASVTLPALTGEGISRVTYWAVDRLGNAENVQVLEVRIDRTSPTLAGLPDQPCTIWPPNGGMVEIARVSGADTLSGVADVNVTATADEAVQPDDIRVDGGTVYVRATRDSRGNGRTYVVSAQVVDRAGNSTSADATCSVPHDHHRPLDQRRWPDRTHQAHRRHRPPLPRPPAPPSDPMATPRSPGSGGTRSSSPSFAWFQHPDSNHRVSDSGTVGTTRAGVTPPCGTPGLSSLVPPGQAAGRAGPPAGPPELQELEKPARLRSPAPCACRSGCAAAAATPAPG